LDGDDEPPKAVILQVLGKVTLLVTAIAGLLTALATLIGAWQG
jgi:hypothetical protein